MKKGVTVNVYRGESIQPFIEHLASLRMTIFREYPYLYDGDKAYEACYLKTYSECEHSLMVIAFSEDQVIGASTAIPLEFETHACKKPFIARDMDVEKIFYFGESLLLPQHRGQHIYRHFFEKREAAAREYGATISAFCAVKRDINDARRPKNYKPLDSVWRHFGYEKHPELCAYYEWKEIGEAKASEKPLIFWLKNL